MKFALQFGIGAFVVVVALTVEIKSPEFQRIVGEVGLIVDAPAVGGGVVLAEDTYAIQPRYASLAEHRYVALAGEAVAARAVESGGYHGHLKACGFGIAGASQKCHVEFLFRTLFVGVAEVVYYPLN